MLPFKYRLKALKALKERLKKPEDEDPKAQWSENTANIENIVTNSSASDKLLPPDETNPSSSLNSNNNLEI